jgi:GcrA cell cycle regulator
MSSVAYEQAIREERRSTKNAATANWTPERIEILTKLWLDGRSGTEIGKELGGVSRCAVIGKAHRLKLSRSAAPAKSNIRYEPRAKRPPSVKPPKKPKPRAFIPAPWTHAQLLPDAKPGDLEVLKGDVWAALPGTSPKPLLAVAEAHGCRWPIGESKPYLFCGEPTHKRDFCASHYAIAFKPVPAKERKPAGRFNDSRILDEEAA